MLIGGSRFLAKKTCSPTLCQVPFAKPLPTLFRLLPHLFLFSLSPSQSTGLEWPCRMLKPMHMLQCLRGIQQQKWGFYMLSTVILLFRNSQTVFYTTLTGVGAFASPLVATQFAQLRHWSFHYLCSIAVSVINTALILVVFRGRTFDGKQYSAN